MRTVLSALGAAAGAVAAWVTAFFFARPVVAVWQGASRDEEAVMNISGAVSVFFAVAAGIWCWTFVQRLIEPERHGRLRSPSSMEDYAPARHADDPSDDTGGGLGKEGLLAIAVVFGVLVWQLFDLYG